MDGRTYVCSAHRSSSGRVAECLGFETNGMPRPPPHSGRNRTSTKAQARLASDSAAVGLVPVALAGFSHAREHESAYSDRSRSQTLRTQRGLLRTTAPARPRHARASAATRRLIRGVAASTASAAALATSPALGLRRWRRRRVSRRRALRERGDGRRNDGKVSGRRRNDSMENRRRGIRRRGGGRIARRRNRARRCPPARRRRPAAAAGSRQRWIRRGAVVEKPNSGAALGVDDHGCSKGPRDGGINRSLDGVNINRVVRPPPKTGDGRAVVEEQSRLRR